MKKKKRRKKKIDKQEKTLLISIVVLLIAIISLSIYAVNLKNIAAKKASNITIPILKEKTENILTINLADMKLEESNEYIFKVTNYRKNITNDKKIDYTIEIISPQNITLKLYKNGDFERNIIKKTNIVEENKLKKNKKQTDEYHLVIKSNEHLENNEEIIIKITS